MSVYKQLMEVLESDKLSIIAYGDGTGDVFTVINDDVFDYCFNYTKDETESADEMYDLGDQVAQYISTSVTTVEIQSIQDWEQNELKLTNEEFNKAAMNLAEKLIEL